MRLFFAVDVDRATREAAERLRARLRAERPTVDRALRWVEPRNLHLTLRFLGERDDIEVIEHAFTDAMASSPFVLEWGVPGWLPPRGRPRVFHVGVARGEDALRVLSDEVGDRLARLGIPAEARPFTAHLTLARVRDGADPGVVRQLEVLVPRQPFSPGSELRVDSVVLYESRLSPQGPTYHDRRRIRLA